MNTTRLGENPTYLGPLVENFVGMELMKQSECSDSRPRLYHYRSQSGAEVDYVLETPDGRVVGVEVKSSGTIRSNDARGLRHYLPASAVRRASTTSPVCAQVWFLRMCSDARAPSTAASSLAS